MFSRFEFKQVLEAGGIAILQPDLSRRRYLSAIKCRNGRGHDAALGFHLAGTYWRFGRLPACRFVSYNAITVFGEQSMGIHYNKGAGITPTL